MRNSFVWGGDVWGVKKNAKTVIDKSYLTFARCLLGVKSTTPNLIVHGECGRTPPSVAIEISTIKFWHRLKRMNDNCLVKQVYNELAFLDSMGFGTWVTSVYELLRNLNFDLDINLEHNFDSYCKQHIRNNFINNWSEAIRDVSHHPKLRTYSRFKTSFNQEPYLDSVKELKYRNAIAKIRTSSHTLAIEKGRFTHPKTPVNQRLCMYCDSIEDEEHFLINCQLNQPDRAIMFNNIQSVYPCLMKNQSEKYIFLMKTDNTQVLKWLGRFIHNSFLQRSELMGVPQYTEYFIFGEFMTLNHVTIA